VRHHIKVKAGDILVIQVDSGRDYTVEVLQHLLWISPGIPEENLPVERISISHPKKKP
jgi:hypothetical protein